MLEDQNLISAHGKPSSSTAPVKLLSGVLLPVRRFVFLMAQADLPPEVNYALRQTLVLCLPVAIGLLLGHLQQGCYFP